MFSGGAEKFGEENATQQQIAPWTVVCVTTRTAEQRNAVQEEVNWLWRCGAIPAKHVLVIEDAYPDLGSGGSTLNALLVVTEYLCGQQNFSVLTDEVLVGSRILIIHCSRECDLNRCGSMFMYTGEDFVTPQRCRLPKSLFMMNLSQITELSARFASSGVWICGSDAYWQVDADDLFENVSDNVSSDHSLSVFTFRADAKLARTHGVYRLNAQNDVVGIDYCSNKYDTCETCETVPLVLALIYMPVEMASLFLLLHSVEPLSSCTYYGVDSGKAGLQLSIFFDFILSLTNQSELSERNDSQDANDGKLMDILSRDSTLDQQRTAVCRKIFSERFSTCNAHACFLKISKYHYFQPATEENFISFWRKIARQGENTVDIHDIAEKIFLPGLEDQSYSQKSLKECFEMNRTRALGKWFNEVEAVLKKDENIALSPIYKSICLLDYQCDQCHRQLPQRTDKQSEQLKTSDDLRLKLIDLFHKVCVDQEDSGKATTQDRTLSNVADVLAFMASGRAGLRTGPAANRAFASAIELLKDEDSRRLGIQAMRKELTNWLQTPEKLIRAARHYEAAAQIFTRRNVMRFCSKQLPLLHSYPPSSLNFATRAVQTECACRIDLAGGWTDTPPITMQIQHSAVLNMAIQVDQKKPFKCYVRCLTEKFGIFIKGLDVHLKTPQEIIHLSSKPSAPGALICATLLASGLVRSEDATLRDAFGRHFTPNIIGLEIYTHSSLPHGSGLGSSSILAAALLDALWSLVGIRYELKQLCHTVLVVEQLLTTGGGWQDQFGGTYAGLKVSRFCRDNEQVEVQLLECNAKFIDELERRLVLVYTGRTRLAKNLLQDVVRKWFARDEQITATLESLAENAEESATLIQQGVFPMVQVERYYESKKRLAPGCEPIFVKKLIDDLKSAGLVEAAWLSGAGGGGFLCVWLMDGISRDTLTEYLRKNDVYNSVSVHSITIDFDPLHRSFDSVNG